MKNLANRPEHSFADQILSDNFSNYAGTTVYKVFDKENGQKTLAIGYLSKAQELEQNSNPYHDGVEKETASTTVSEENNIRQVISNDFTDITDITKVKKIPIGEKERVDFAHSIYYNYVSGIVRSFVDFMADIAFDGFRHQVDKSKPNADTALTWFDEWIKQVRLKNILMNGFSDLFTTNNALLWCLKAPYIDKFFEDLTPIAKASRRGINRSTAHFTDTNAATMVDKRVFGDEQEYYVYNKALGRCLDSQEIKEYAARKLRWTRTQIPSHIFNVAAQCTDITGGRYPGMRRYRIHIDAETRRFITQNPDFVARNFPPEFTALFNEKDSRAKTDLKGNLLITVTEENMFQVSIRRRDWELWGQPSWLSVVPTLKQRKEKLNTDQVAASKLIKQLVLVTIGDKDFPATEKQLIAAAALFRNPSASFTVFWNHTMKVQFLGPSDLAEMMGNQTYEPLDKGVAEAMGFPLALFGIGNANFATLSKQILPVKHKAESARMSMMECFLIPLYDAIHKVMGWEPGTVTPKFNTNILEDPAQLVKRLMMYVDRRVVPYREVAELLPEGFTFDNLIESFRQEKPDIEEGLYGESQPRGSFGRPADDPDPTSPDDVTQTPEGDGDTRGSERELEAASHHGRNGSR